MKNILNKSIYISQELVDHFKILFPNTLPVKRNISSEDIAFLQGQQTVIQRMSFILDDDQPDEN